jgi:hypothetical protein
VADILGSHLRRSELTNLRPAVKVQTPPCCPETRKLLTAGSKTMSYVSEKTPHMAVEAKIIKSPNTCFCTTALQCTAGDSTYVTRSCSSVQTSTSTINKNCKRKRIRKIWLSKLSSIYKARRIIKTKDGQRLPDILYQMSHGLEASASSSTSKKCKIENQNEQLQNESSCYDRFKLIQTPEREILLVHT